MGVLDSAACTSNIVDYFPARTVLQSLAESNKIKDNFVFTWKCKGI